MAEKATPDSPKSAAATRLSLAMRCIGILVTLACLVYVGKAIWNNEEAVGRMAETPSLLWTIAGASLLWVGVNSLLGALWRSVGHCIGMEVSLSNSLVISYLSQIAKYLPGNVFHLAGRVWRARSMGLSAKSATLATVGESLALACVALLIGLPILGLLPYGTAIGFGIGVSAGVFAIVILIRRAAFERLLHSLGVSELRLSGRTLVSILSTSVGVFALQYAMFFAVKTALGVDLELGVFECFQMVTITWLAGFLVVGSPGGIGVREATFALFASSAEMQSTLLLIAALMRVSSILGDALSFALGKWLER